MKDKHIHRRVTGFNLGNMKVSGTERLWFGDLFYKEDTAETRRGKVTVTKAAVISKGSVLHSAVDGQEVDVSYLAVMRTEKADEIATSVILGDPTTGKMLAINEEHISYASHYPVQEAIHGLDIHKDSAVAVDITFLIIDGEPTIRFEAKSAKVMVQASVELFIAVVKSYQLPASAPKVLGPELVERCQGIELLKFPQLPA